MPKRGVEEEEEVSDGEEEKSEGRWEEGRGRGWSGVEEAGVKSGTRLVPAFHSHWPCRSLYRCSSSSSFFFFSFSTSSSSAPCSYSFLFAMKEKERQRILLDRLCLLSPRLASPSSPPLRHFTSAACSTSTGSGHFEGPRDEDIPRVHFAKFPIFNGPVLVLESTDPSPNYFHFIAEFVLAQISSFPLDLFLPLVL